MRLVTLSPSVPASGESFTRNVIASVGGSIGCAAIGVDFRAHNGVGDVRLRQAGDGDDIARAGFIDRLPLKAAEGEHLGDAAVFQQFAVARKHFHGLVRISRCRT
jgi:hypothetical protein